MFIFLIDANPLISEWLERLAAKRGQRFYSLSSLDEAAFFIQDLKPDILVIDGATARKSTGGFMDGLGEHPLAKDIPTLGLGDALPEWAGILNIKGHIPKPLNPAHFYDQVKMFL